MAPFVEVARSLAIGSALVQRGFEYRDNRVHFKGTNGVPKIDSGSFKIQKLSITNGQDPQNRNVCGLEKDFNASKGTFSFDVGRKGDKSNAAWFNGQVTRGQNTFNKTPGKLNFGFEGELGLSLPINANKEKQVVKFYEVVLAQGHEGFSNNWWFGGKQCSPDGNHRVKCVGHTKEGWVWATFKRGGNDANTVEVQGVTYERRGKPPTTY